MQLFHHIDRTIPVPPIHSIPTRGEDLEIYQSVETLIRKAMEVLMETGDDSLKIAAAAREFHLPTGRLRSRWQEVQSKQARRGANRMLTWEQELALSRYSDRLDAVGVVG